MTKIAISPNVSGTGTFTIAAPDSNTDRTLTLPDAAGEVLTNTSDIEAQVKAATSATGTAPVYAARAWVNFNGTGTVAIRASGNVSSITDNGAGDYTINFATAMPDVNYSVTGTISSNSNSTFTVSTVAGRTFNLVGSVKVVTAFANAGNNNFFDPDDVSIAIFR